MIYTNAEVSQGSLLSPLLYMFYNAELLEIPEERSNALRFGFIDDIAYRTQGKTVENNIEEMERMLTKFEE